MKILLWGSKEYPFGVSTGDKYPSGGIEKTIDSLAYWFSKKGQTVIIITRKIKTDVVFDDSQLLRQNIIVRRMLWVKGKFLRMPSYNLCAFFYLLFTKRDYDILYTRGIFANFLGFFISKLKGVNQYMSTSGITTTQKQYSLFKLILTYLERYTYTRKRVIIFASKDEKKVFESELKINPAKYIIVPQGVTIKPINEKKVSTLKQKYPKTNILYVGRFSKVKNVDLLIKGVKDLDVNLILIGSGEEELNLKSLVFERGLQKKVFFEGFSRDVQNYYKIAKLFVLLSDSEGLSNSLLEAMSLGIPCIVSKTIKLPFTNKDCVVFVDKDESQIKLQIEKLLNNPSLYERISKNAKKEIALNYNWDRISEIYITEFNKMVFVKK